MGREKTSTLPEDKVPNLLRIIIRLLIEKQISGQQMNMNDAILLLDSMDVGSTEIGQIVGWSQGAVASKLTKLKKAKKQ